MQTGKELQGWRLGRLTSCGPLGSRKEKRRLVVETTRTERTLSAADGSMIAIVELEGSRPGPTLAVVSGVHGDEVACLGGLWDWLYGADLISGRVLACPVAHPAALHAGTRLGREGADLNRVFPGDTSGSPTQRLAASLFAELLDGADALLTLHSWSRTGATVPYVEYPITGSASAVERSAKLARSLGVAYVEAYAWEPGLLPAAAVAEGVPAVELEIGGLGTANAEGEAIAATAIDGAAHWLGIIEGEGSASVIPAVGVRRHWLRTAHIDGIVRQRCLLGDEVSAGEVVAEICEQTGRVVETLAAPVGGVVAIHLTYGYTTAGSAVAVVFELT
jgi:predicted deacylase